MILFNWLSFLIDLPSLDAWLASQYSSNYLGIRSEDVNFAVRLNLNLSDMAAAKTAITAHLATLTHDGEAAKRALKSRLRNATDKTKQAECVAFEASVKLYLSGKTIGSWTVPEKKFVLGVPLINDDYDTLTSS